MDGLEPGRWYWYRFRNGVDESAVGRTRTLPAPGAPADALRFAFASCQHYEHGYFTAYRHMAEDDLDLVFHGCDGGRRAPREEVSVDRFEKWRFLLRVPGGGPLAALRREGRCTAPIPVGRPAWRTVRGTARRARLTL